MPFKPLNTPILSIYLSVSDPERLADFYQKAFGFKLRQEPMKNEEGIIQHVEMSFYDALIMFASDKAWLNTGHSPKTSGTQAPVRFYLYCENVDALYEKAMNHGAESQEALQDAFWGDRFCKLRDIEGYEWCFATHLGEGVTKV